MWMNACDITEARIRCAGVPFYGQAAEYLDGFRELIDGISDGWPYWDRGTKCSDDLQTLVGDGMWPARRLPPAEARRRYDGARSKIRRFLSTCPQTKDNELVKAFLEGN